MPDDAESDRTILFGGGSPWFMYGDTWAYDADSDTWEEMSPAQSPSPRAMYGATYDAESDRVLLWGGFTGDEENDVRLWAYDYNSDSWEAMPNETGPQQHWERHGMAYVPGIDKVLVFSGMLEEAPEKPEDFMTCFNQLLEQPTAEHANALFERVRDFRDWGVSDLDAYTWFMTDVEWAWMRDETPLEDW